MKAIKIVNWDKHYENSQSRRYVKTQWIPIPNKHDGEGYCRLWTENENPAEIFSAWILILQVASKCNTRGLLVKDNGTPHDSMSLSLKTRAPKCIFDSALEFLQTIGWIEMVKGDAKCESRSTLGARSEHAPSPSNNCTPERKEKNRTEPKRKELKPIGNLIPNLAGKLTAKKNEPNNSKLESEIYDSAKQIYNLDAAAEIASICKTFGKKCAGEIKTLMKSSPDKLALIVGQAQSAKNKPAYVRKMLKSGNGFEWSDDAYRFKERAIL